MCTKKDFDITERITFSCADKLTKTDPMLNSQNVKIILRKSKCCLMDMNTDKCSYFNLLQRKQLAAETDRLNCSKDQQIRTNLIQLAKLIFSNVTNNDSVIKANTENRNKQKNVTPTSSLAM